MSRQARSLDVFLAEVNRHAPARSKASDGGRGDSAHTSRPSDHNPNELGVWRAYDVTDDPAGGLVGSDLALRVAARLGQHPALGPGAYVIHDRKIVSADRIREGWRPYSGANPHTTHVHVSVATAAAGYDSTLPWNLWPAVTPRIDHAIDDLTKARDARKPGPVRRAIREALQKLRAIKRGEIR